MKEPASHSASPATPAHQTKNSKFFDVFRACVFYTLFVAVTLVLLSESSHKLESHFNDYAQDTQCPQVKPLSPEKNVDIWRSIGSTIETDAFKRRAIGWLARAVRIKTETYDNMNPVGIDPRWDCFIPFHDYLRGAFPLVHSTLELNKVNTLGLWYIWAGTDTSKKPILLAAHQDVVPVDPSTIGDWAHPPYSGYYDGDLIWGRGSMDDKNGLISVLSAIEVLIERGFQPSRTVVLSFGFDEEASGEYGARELAKILMQTYGEDSFAFILDEGSGFIDQYGMVFAVPGVAEKGYLDVCVEVTSPGGHSSIPPDHTVRTYQQ